MEAVMSAGMATALVGAGQGVRMVTARVARVDGGSVLLQIEKEPPPAQVWATPALAHVYAPLAGDRVIAIGAAAEEGSDGAGTEVAGGWYVIGVLEAHGATEITAVGDLRLRSLTGSVELTGARGVAVRGPLLSITVDAVQTVARTVSETCVEAMRWVKERLDVRAGRSQTVVDGVCRTKAERVIVRTDREIKLDGDTIHLG